MLDKKAQAFAGYRLLIGVIMALAVLVTIISAINYFSGFQVSVSEQRLKEGFEIALENVVEPGSDVVVVKEDLLFEPTTFSTRQFSKAFAIPQKCIEFQALDIESFEVLGSGRTLKINKQIDSDVFFQCIRQVNEECIVYCIISFSKKPGQ